MHNVLNIFLYIYIFYANCFIYIFIYIFFMHIVLYIIFFVSGFFCCLILLGNLCFIKY